MKSGSIISTIIAIGIVFFLWKKGLFDKLFNNNGNSNSDTGPTLFSIDPHTNDKTWDGLFPNGESDPHAPFNANHVARHVHNMLYDRGSLNQIVHFGTLSGQSNTWAYLLSLTDTQLRNVVGAYYKIIKKGDDGLTEAILNNSMSDMWANNKTRLITRLKSLNA